MVPSITRTELPVGAAADGGRALLFLALLSFSLLGSLFSRDVEVVREAEDGEAAGRTGRKVTRRPNRSPPMAAMLSCRLLCVLTFSVLQSSAAAEQRRLSPGKAAPEDPLPRTVPGRPPAQLGPLSLTCSCPGSESFHRRTPAVTVTDRSLVSSEAN